MKYSLRTRNNMCIFCDFQFDKEKVVAENNLAYAIFDAFPVSQGHTLIIPKRHAETFFELTNDEVVAIYELAHIIKQKLTELYNPSGYNVGFNCGEAAGQTIMHCHMHIIPRYSGDIQNPRGGVRKIIKNKVPYDG